MSDDSSHLRPPRQRRSARTLQRMLDAAEELLADRPFDEIRVDEIAARAGCTKGAFYHRFEDKDALLRHLNGRVFDEALEGWDRFLAPERWEGRGAVEVAEAFVRRLVGIYLRSGPLMRAFVHQARWRGDAVVRERARELNGFVRDRLLRLFRERRDQLPARTAGRLDASVDVWIGACVGCLGQLLLFADPEVDGYRIDPERAAEEAVHLLVPYIRGDDGTALPTGRGTGGPR